MSRGARKTISLFKWLIPPPKTPVRLCYGCGGKNLRAASDTYAFMLTVCNDCGHEAYETFS
jgi:hypothetical protein